MRGLVLALAWLAGTLATPRWSAAASTVMYSAYVRCQVTPPDPEAFTNTVNLSTGWLPNSATTGSLTPFDRGGPGSPCPDPSTQNYLCWRAYAAAEAVTLHAAARV